MEQAADRDLILFFIFEKKSSCRRFKFGDPHLISFLPSFCCFVVYVAFMVVVDVPMYLERWRYYHGDDKLVKEHSLLDGFLDAWRRRHVTQDWHVWKPEVAWLTMYFSFAVWTSIAMNHLP